jgi:CRP/FNR family transcriptional regulator, anaerobic regulatory protein
MNQLESIFIKFGFSESEAKEISKSFVLKHYKSGCFFLQDGMIGDFLGFVEGGVFQFYYNNDSDELTTYIAFKDDFILSVQSFFAGKRSKENIKSLVDSDVWVIKKSAFEKLINSVKGFKDFYISVLEQIMVCLDESRFNYITLKPEERYVKLINEEPELIQQIPLKYLSSLIGVTPRHLSRIRKNFK